jgi:hypothetical protein
LNALESLLTDTTQDVTYEGTTWVPLDAKGKPTRSWMCNWPQERRIQKFFEFCRAYDRREDSLLRENYQQFSHRLHWNECPFVDEVKGIQDPRLVLEACIRFSFTNEHWLTHRTAMDHGVHALMERFQTERACRSDLFQIYYPKGTKVETWLVNAPITTASRLAPSLVLNSRPYSMMEYAKILNKHFVDQYGFRNAMYPSKNAARHVAMSHPEWVDPTSFLHGGTGFFDGLKQVFDCGDIMSKAKYKLADDGEYLATNAAGQHLVEMMNELKFHPDNPIRMHHYLNLEDKLCMHYKFMAIHHGVKKQTKQIPYSWVYPENWSLRTGKYDRLLRN